MMELRHVTMVNWHLFDVEDIEIRGNVGVLGENRSGKSTILDLAQVVLTGANRQFLRLNSVAGDKGGNRGGSKRSVVDYCLGALGEDERRRNEARTYIALGFADTEGLRPPVTIGMAIEARKSETNETVLGRFVLVGKILTSAEFIEVREQGRFPAQWDDVRARIVAAVGEANFVNHRDHAGRYVREYMRHLVPHASFISEQNAASLQKAIVNAMTMNHDQTATEFVRKYVLEDNPIRVRELRESIQTYRNINDTIRRMRERLEALKAIRAILTELETMFEQRYREHWIAKRGDWLAARATNRELRRKHALEAAQRDAAGKELAFIDEDLAAIDKEIERLNVAVAEHDMKTGRHALTLSLTMAADAAGRNAAVFRTRLEWIRKLQCLCTMQGLGFDEHVGAIAALVSAARDAAVARLPDELAAAEAAVLDVATTLLDRLDDARRKLFREEGDQREGLARLRERLRRHADGHHSAHLSETTVMLCRRLRQGGMAPRVLCDLVEVAKDEWIAAAEGLLGRDREAVFVDRPHVAQATMLFKEGGREFRGAALVSLNKLDEYRSPPQNGTFPTIFRSADPDAMAFIMRRHGSVRLSETLTEFNAPGRAIMKDGLYDDGLVRTHRAVEPSDYKIGKAAQAQALLGLREQAEDLELLLQETRRRSTDLDGAHRALQSLVENRHATVKSIADAHATAIAERTETEARIAALDGAGDGGLREKRRVQADLKRLRGAERKKQQETSTRHAGQAIALASKLAEGENVPGSNSNVKATWSIYGKILDQYDRRSGRSAYRTRLDRRAHKSDAERHRGIATDAAEAVKAANEARVGIERRAREALGEYFNTNMVSSRVGTESPLLTEVRPWADELIHDIETNELRHYERQARDAAEKAATLLRGEFINALTSRIGKMERDIQALNRSLNDHPFHNERYSFHRTQEAEFQPILKIIEIGRTAPEALDMLFRGNEMPADFPYKDTIAELEALLEDPQKDFTRFEDYKNFYTFEIHMQDVITGRTTRWETRRGTGSGAEQQVPIYVAIGASLASVYASAERRPGQPAGIAPAIFDEAFSKMDGKNQRQMMSFYKALGLQIVIAAPYEKRVSVLEHMDTIVEVDRIGERSRATVVALKDRTRRELTAINPDLMSDADLTARIAAE
jgi:hypothetical protein